jgi:hypothetical protein
MAARLSGVRDAGDVLVALYRRDYFTSRRSGHDGTKEPIYEFHPLFQRFLLAEGRRVLAPARRRAIQLAAARLLDGEGRIDEAASLYRNGEAWRQLGDHICRHAAVILGQGRNDTLAGWLDALPPARIDRTPWLLFWRGLGRIATRFAESRRDMRRAIDRFVAAGDAAGAYTAWAEAVFSVTYESRSAADFQPWLELFQTLRQHFPSVPDPSTEARVASGMAMALVWSAPSHGETQHWVEVAERLSRPHRQLMARALALFVVCQFHLQRGRFHDARQLAPELTELAAKATEPITVVLASIALTWLWLAALDHKGAAQRALQMARTHRLHNVDSECLLNLLAAHLSDGDLTASAGALEQLALVVGRSGNAYRLWHLMYAAWDALVRGNVSGARATVTTMMASLHTGRLWDEAVARMIAAQVMRASNQRDAAHEHVKVLSSLANQLASRYVEFAAHWIDAELAFVAGQDAAGLIALARALQS